VTVQEFRLPDVGEGLLEAEILRWHVAPGDEVKLNMIVVEIETAKSAVELPSPFAGTVVEILAGEGETIEVGSVLLTISSEGVPSSPARVAPALAAAINPGAQMPPEVVDDGSRSVLVGYGPTPAAEGRRTRRQTTGRDGSEVDPDAPAQATTRVLQPTALARAKPPVRKLARDLGIDLNAVIGSGPQGTVTRDEVHAHFLAATSDQDPALTPLSVSDSIDDVRIPVRGVRKATAQAVVASAFTAPHVTEFLTVDVTATMDLVTRLRQDPEFAGTKVTPLLIVARAVLVAVHKHPQINACWDEKNHEIVQKAGVNLGIAAATPRGLIVPNINRADRLSLPELARMLAQLTTVAREGKTPPEAMAGGTFTITNVGVFGVDAATPILNPGEAAILCFGAVRQRPWVHEGQVVPRWTTQLSLSFDHRLVDGELGSQVLATIGSVLFDPLWWLATI
jgi:2-oxoisovalerate dehydrogenase E2 component (dihydrolipoyl transacylase)